MKSFYWGLCAFLMGAVLLCGVCGGLSLEAQEAPAQGVDSEPAAADPAGQALQPSAPEMNAPALLPAARRKEIVVENITESLEDRLGWNISLDVREMNIVDVLKFLALKGNFNLVTSPQVQGRVTLYLKNVRIYDALDIILIANNLAYYVQSDIVYVLSAQEYQFMLGKKFNDKNIVEIIQLKYAKPSYVLSALENLKSDLGRIIIDEDTGSVIMIDTPESIAKMRLTIDQIESPLEPFIYTLQFAKAAIVADKLKERIDANAVGSVAVDERTNKIIVRALPERRKEVEKVIQSLDAPTKEVLVEVRVLQVVFRPQMDTGIDWQLDFRESTQNILERMNFSNIFLDEDSLTSSENLYKNFSKIGIGDFDKNQFELAIRALKQVSNTRILSNPKILVTNNEEAKIHIGDTVPYIISTTSGTGDNAVTSEDVRFVDVGIKLNVTPTISDNGFISMVLKPEISTVVSRISSQGGGIPQVNKTLVETTVIVKDGMTIVLGGLRKDNKVNVTKGVPGLMNIPFINKLFSSSSESIEATETIIFITPHILLGHEGVDSSTGNMVLSNKMNGGLPEQVGFGGVKVEEKRLELKE